MTIAEAREKCKGALGKIPRDMLVIAVLISASSASFGLGFLAGQDARAGQGSDVAVEQAPMQKAGTPAATVGEDGVVASKTGTKYYLPSCAGASRISEANKVWFTSAAAAAAAGYAPAVNCKGL